MYLPGSQLERIFSNAESEVVLIAPFIKEHVLLRILEELHDQVKLICITRWKVEEIASGVSDLSIWPILAERKRTSLFLRADLHAKYYRGDDRCLVGSANLTGAALGWAKSPNLELLIELPASMTVLKDFEQMIIPGCVFADELLYQKYLKAVESIKRFLPFDKPAPSKLIDFPDDTGKYVIHNVERWLPKLRHPENLYFAYVGNIDRLGSASVDAASQDLAALPIQPGLSEEAFKICVGALLLQKPIIQKIDHFAKEPQRFGAVKAFLKKLPCNENADFDPEIAWQTLMRWLTYFLPERYAVSVPNYSEVFYRIGI